MTGIERQDDHVGTTEALAWVDRLDETVRRRSRWFTRHLLAFGVMTFVATSAPGLIGGRWSGALCAAVYGGFGVALALYSWRDPRAARELLRRHAPAIIVWTLLFFAVVSVGAVQFPYTPVWWFPGAAVVALPLFVGAYLEHRRQPASEEDDQ